MAASGSGSATRAQLEVRSFPSRHSFLVFYTPIHSQDFKMPSRGGEQAAWPGAGLQPLASLAVEGGTPSALVAADTRLWLPADLMYSLRLAAGERVLVSLGRGREHCPAAREPPVLHSHTCSV